MHHNALNHGLTLPPRKYILERGLFIYGVLQTNRGRDIEVALRKAGSFSYYLCAEDSALVANPQPIRLFPDPEQTDEIVVPEDLFNPYYNCHGLVFGDSQYWINPYRFIFNNTGIERLLPNVEIILEDEFQEVRENEDWDIAILRNNNSEILHSVKKVDNEIISKYDQYRLMSFEGIQDVDIRQYGVGAFSFYRQID